MKFLRAVLIITVIAVFSSCGGKPARVAVFLDNAPGVDRGRLSNDISSFMQKNAGRTVPVSFIEQDGALAGLLSNTREYLSNNGFVKEGETLFFLALKPYRNQVEDREEFQALAGTLMSVPGGLRTEPGAVTNPSVVLDSLKSLYDLNREIPETTLLLWGVRVYRATVLFITNGIVPEAPADLKEVLAESLGQQLTGNLEISFIQTNGSADLYKDSAADDCRSLAGPDALGAYYFVFEPLSNSLTGRLDYKAVFASHSSRSGNSREERDYLEKPADIFSRLGSVALSGTAVRIYGYPYAKAALIMLDREGLEKAGLDDGSEALSNAVSAARPDITEWKIADYSGDTDSMDDKMTSWANDNFPAGVDECVIAVIKPYENVTEGRNEYILMLGTLPLNNSAVQKPLRTNLVTAGDLGGLVKGALLAGNGRLVDGILVTEPAVDDSYRISTRCLEYRTYSRLINDQSWYLLVNEVPGIESEAILAPEEIQSGGVFDPDRPAVRRILDALDSARALALFFNDKRQIDRRLVLFEYVTTGRITVRFLYGPVNPATLEDTRRQLDSYGIRTRPKPVKGGAFR